MEALLHIFNLVMKKGRPPKAWKRVNIKSLYKNKGDKRDLNNQRGIFLLSAVQKLFEKMILDRIMNRLEMSFTEYQNGARKNRSTADHLFVARAMLDLHEYFGLTTTMQFFDMQKCFDKLWLRRCMVSLRDAGVQGPEWRTIFELNCDAEIAIITPLGTTDILRVGEVVMQGSVLAAIMCGKLIDEIAKCLELAGGGTHFEKVPVPTL